MDANMSVQTRSEVMVKLRSRYRSAGFKHRAKLIDQAVEVFGYHRKSAIVSVPNIAPADNSYF
ncbi:MAG TPA: hypothetical protein VF773_19075, partial [Verrucomicrobiae bacterium]